MTPMALKDEMSKVVDSLKRGNSGHAYGGAGDRFMLTIGSPQGVQVAGVRGTIVAVGIDKAQALELRESLDRWLAS